ncbi:DIS3-like exonuclease 2 isoform X1 [Actinidia eriantha]|uniref:DIS3-like exonuclease 2 isoform X1 n=1 Tax=Actinidia eriantha TaxID=165200 RepID=UPI002582A475|nr:DIS3-like exonuclease 2 isoform X1 [Actinidia eriantha]
MRGVFVDQSHVEKAEDVEKDKKKRRRPNRRSKQNSSVSVGSDVLGAACGSLNELRAEPSEIVESSVTFNEQHLPRTCDVAFISLPTMHINEKAAPPEGRSMQNQQLNSSDYGGTMISKSCPETTACKESIGSYASKDCLLSHQICHQRKYFASHWSIESVNEALEKGHIFKALFRVNAHNRLEAYCKIDGVQTDVLISGVPAQNRAVEGDIVAIEIDPSSSWTKMKGSSGTFNNSGSSDDYNSVPEVTGLVGDRCKGKNNVDAAYEYVNGGNCSPFLVKGFHYKGGASSGADVGPELIEHNHSVPGNSYTTVNGHCSTALDPSQTGFPGDRNEVASSVEKLNAIISSFPSKRPTGRVVAILERSRRRDTVVGYLSVNQCLSNREECKKESKKGKKNILSLNLDCIMLTPTDPKFPKMMVFVRDLPDIIKKRWEDGDATIDMELVAARIDDWREENYLPQAHVLHIFGRGGEIEPQIAAILFQNAIYSSEFSAESLSCLPCGPWEVPLEEFKSRRDLRNLCIFTIDPSTATDLDDALSVERLPSSVVRVGVHIADVSYFVHPDTALDIEARIRSTSVYLLRGKLPMLPSLLSNNLGSLNPGVDRLAVSIFWDINLTGEIMDQWIGPTVIRSCCKLSYENAQDIIDGLFDVEGFSTSEDGLPKLHNHFDWSDVVRSVKSLHDISKILKEKRFDDGALRLDSSKPVFFFDEDGTPYDSILSERKDSDCLVEEFMLLANRTAAEVIYRAYPDSALLRRQPQPNLRKLREFEAFCSKHGFELVTSSSGQLHHSLERIRDLLKNDSVLFNIFVSYATKPMQLATYFCSGDLKDGEKDLGHYALAVPLYTHFTSPLRRYPDIVVHRTLTAIIEAEEMYLKHRRTLQKLNNKNELTRRCFTGTCFDKDAAESIEGQEALSAAASKCRVPCSEVLADVAAHCNERKLASKNVKDASDKLYTWFLLKKKEILLTEARVLGLGPRFMSIYVHKLAIERRIYYDEVEELSVEWLDATSTLVLSLSTHKRLQRRGSPGKYRTLEDVALVTSPFELALDIPEESGNKEWAKGSIELKSSCANATEIEPAVFPLTVRLLSTIPVALHAVGGDDGPLVIETRLYMSSYFR